MFAYRYHESTYLMHNLFHHGYEVTNPSFGLGRTFASRQPLFIRVGSNLLATISFAPLLTNMDLQEEKHYRDTDNLL